MAIYFNNKEIKSIAIGVTDELSVDLIDGRSATLESDAVKNVRKYAFYQYPSLVNAIFNKATEIGDYAFYKCPNLEVCTTPLVNKIGLFAFKGCEKLLKADFPLVSEISNGIFDECLALNEVNMPLITSIEELMFRKCESLTTIDLANVTYIGSQAFYSSGISRLVLRSAALVTLKSADAFYYTPIESGEGFIYVPSDLVETYKADTVWSTYANQIKSITELD